MMQQKSISLFQLWFWLITRSIGWFVMGCFSCIVVATMMVTLQDKQSGFAGLQVLLNDEYQYIVSMAAPNTLLTLHEWLQRIPNSMNMPAIQLPIINPNYLVKLWLSISPLIGATLLGTKLLFIRFYLLLHWCLLFLLFGLVGLTDGLAQRAVRRAAAGRESALVYHHAKSLVSLSLILGIFMVLTLPVSTFHMELVLVSASIVFGLAIQTTAKRFKKYL